MQSVDIPSLTSEWAERDLRGSARVLCGFIAGFIVYGSLFPFNFQSATQSISVSLVHWNPFADRADAADNFFLFVPLGVALYFCFLTWTSRLPAAAAAWLLLGVGLQVWQLYLPSRVASLADAINNAIGLATGLGIAAAISPWLRRLRIVNPSSDLFAGMLVLLWYCYESFPFVPTLDVGLLRAHIKPAIQAPDFEFMRFMRHAIAACLGMMLMLRSQFLQPRRLNIAVLASVAFLSEILVPYGDLRIETLLGIALGMWAGERLESGLGPRVRFAVLALALVALLTTVLTPFRAQPAIMGFTLTPFSQVLWHGTTSGVPPAAFEALAIGSLLWFGLLGERYGGPRPWRWPAMVVALLMGLEVMRVLVVGYRGDTTTWFIALVLAPFAVALRRRREPAQSSTATQAPIYTAGVPRSGSDASPVRAQRSRLNWPRLAPLRDGVIATLCLATGLWLVMMLPSLPYNLKELFGPSKPVSILLFSVALLWLGSGPWWVASVAALMRPSALWVPPLLCAASLFSLMLLKLSVTQESLDDIIGSPDLYRRAVQESYWGSEWRERFAPWPAAVIGAVESSVRYVALYCLPLIPLTAGAICTNGRWRLPRAAAGLVMALACWWLAKFIVVDWAITDNLVELIAPDGVPYLGLLLLLFASHVTVLSVYGEVRRLPAMAALTTVAACGTWWLFLRGLEAVILKYGVVFSAAQFLLGENRTSHLTEWQLFARWCIFYLFGVGICTLGMVLGRRACMSRPAPREGQKSRLP